MGRCEALLEEKTHRVALITESWLDADEDIAEMLAQNQDRRPVGLVNSGRRAPLGFDLRKIFFPADMAIDRNARCDVRRLAEVIGIAAQDAVAERVDIRRQVHFIAFALHRGHGVVQRAEHGQMRRGACRAAIGREVEQHDRDLPVRELAAPQADQLVDPSGKHRRALRFACHVPAAGFRATGLAWHRAPAIDHRSGGAVDLGQGDHHRRLDRRQPLFARPPFLQALELDREGRQIGHVEPGEHFLRRP